MILSVPPDDLARARDFGRSIAHMAYRIGQGAHLFRANIPLSLQGGLMMLGEPDADLDSSGSPEVLAAEVMRECIHRGFHGVVLAFHTVSPFLQETAARLSQRLSRQGGALYLPESYADCSDWASVLIPTAISGGRLADRLEDAVAQYSGARVCLDIERIRLDFCLPTERDNGRRLSAKELHVLMEAERPQAYFSQDLVAYYFTYQDDDGSHFVLYDDAGSIRKKLFLAKKLGIDSAMLLFPEVEDVLPGAISLM